MANATMNSMMLKPPIDLEGLFFVIPFSPGEIPKFQFRGQGPRRQPFVSGKKGLGNQASTSRRGALEKTVSRATCELNPRRRRAW